MIINNVVFDFPSRSLGGTQFLYMRCAMYLAEKSNYKIWYIDYSDGFVCNKIKNTSVNIIDYKEDEKTIIPSHSVVVIQLNWIDKIYERNLIDDTSTVLLWAITPASLTCKIFVKGFRFLTGSECRDIGKNLRALSSSGVINYMDYENYLTNANCFNYSIDKVAFLPIFINDNQIIDEESLPKYDLDNYIKFAWLGRLDKDKVPTLITYMNELESIPEDKFLYIIGSGECVEQVLKISKSYHYQIEFVGPKIDNELDGFIDNNVDVGLAMGTSALEFAKRGKPVIIHGFMGKPCKSGVIDNYVFGHQMHKYTPSTPQEYVEGQSLFSEKIKMLHEDYELICASDYEYIRKNHTCHQCCQQLVNSIDNLSYTDYNVTYASISEITRIFGKARSRIDFFVNIKRILLKGTK